MCASEYKTKYSLVSVGHVLSPVCLRRASELIATLTTQCVWRSRPNQRSGVTLWSAALSLATRGTTGEEVSGHLSFPLHLDNSSAVQLVSVAGQHVVQVCGHLGEGTDI